MRSQKATKSSCSEPIYDDCTLELIEQQQVEELIAALAEYCKNLEKQVVDLRCQVNCLTPSNIVIPFFDLHADLYEVFYHYDAYPKFKHILKQLE